VQAAAEHHALSLDERLPLGAGLAAYLVAMAAIRAATNWLDWGRRAASRCSRRGARARAGRRMSALALVAITAAVLVVATAIDLRCAPPSPVPVPMLPHQLARRRGA
jgi:hypothetical protein